MSKHSLPFPDIHKRIIPPFTLDVGLGQETGMDCEGKIMYQFQASALRSFCFVPLGAFDYHKKNMLQVSTKPPSWAPIWCMWSTATALHLQVCSMKKRSPATPQSCEDMTILSHPTDIHWVISLSRCLKIIFFSLYHLLALGTMSETEKPFSKQMLVFFFLKKEWWKKFKIETFLISTSQILNIVDFLLGLSYF